MKENIKNELTDKEFNNWTKDSIYMKEKIKNELTDKEFNNWTKDSIDFIISIFEFEENNDLYSDNLTLLDSFIRWYELNIFSFKNEMYPLYKLKNIYCKINEDIYYKRHNNYIRIMNNSNRFFKLSTCDLMCDELFQNVELLKYPKLCFLMIGICIIIIFIILKYILLTLFYKRMEEKKYIFELKIPLFKDPVISTNVSPQIIDKIAKYIPNNLLDNPLIKLILGKVLV